MSQTDSPSAGKPYGLQRVLSAWRISKSAFYQRRASMNQDEARTEPKKKRGPKTELSDDAILGMIREVLEASPWKGEGYRKVHARLRQRGVRVASRRVLRLMRENDLLSPVRVGKPHGPKAHDGTIVTEQPDEMWGTDATSTLTGEGNATIFFAIDHCTAEIMGIHAAKHGNRFAALEVIKQGVKKSFGNPGKWVAKGLTLRHDNGS